MLLPSPPQTEALSPLEHGAGADPACPTGASEARKMLDGASNRLGVARPSTQLGASLISELVCPSSLKPLRPSPCSSCFLDLGHCPSKMPVPPDVDEAARGHVHMLSQDLQQLHSCSQAQGPGDGRRQKKESGATRSVIFLKQATPGVQSSPPVPCPCTFARFALCFWPGRPAQLPADRKASQDAALTSGQ